MNFNRFNSIALVRYDNIKNFPKSLEAVSNIFNGFDFNHVDYSFKDYGRLFSHIEMKDWKKLYDLVILIWDKFEDDSFGISHRSTDEKMRRINNYFAMNFSGYLEEGELYNQYAMVNVKGEPHELLFWEFQLNSNFTKKNGDDIIQRFLNKYAKEEI